MQLSLKITASASVLAQILSSLPADAEASMDGAPPIQLPPLPGAGAPAPMPTPPMPAPIPDAADEEGADNPNAPAVDKAGYPWDERIHAKTKATNGDDTWRYRRGLQSTPEGKALIASVEAELAARVGAGTPPPPVAAPVPMPAPQPAPPPVAAPAPIPVAAPAPVVPPMPAPVAAAPAIAPPVAPVAQPAPSDTPLDMTQFMMRLGEQMQKHDAAGAPLVHAEYLDTVVQRIVAAYGTPIGVITDIAPYPHMIQYAVQLMVADGRW